MADQAIERSPSALSPDKSVTTILPRNLKAASSLLKSISSLDSRKTISGNLPSHLHSVQSIQKTVSVATIEKFASNDSPDMRKEDSAREMDVENPADEGRREKTILIADSKTRQTLGRKRATKFMRKYPELFRDDVSINPSYTALRKLPYNVVCRQRFHNNKSRINRQLNKEIDNITMMQTLALDGVRVRRIFTIGFHPSATIVPDFATPSERVKNGYIKRVTDDEVKSLVLEIAGTNVATTFISCPKDPKKVLGIKLPFLIMIAKNMKKYFTFEITILDDKDMHRRFRFSNFQSTTRVRPFCTTMPIGLSGGWNQIQFNLADFTRRAYGSNYIETTRMQIHANCRIRRIYYADRLYTEDEMPEEFKLFLPIRRRRSTLEGRTSKSVQNKGAEGDRIPDEPPPFALVPEGEEFKKLESGTRINPVEESVLEYPPKRSEIGPGISEPRRSSDLVPQKSLSSSKYETKGKSVDITIRKKSKDESIPVDQEKEEIYTEEEGEEEENNAINAEERAEEGETLRHESNDQSAQLNTQIEVPFEFASNIAG